ncbi:MAG: hypothetical protein GTO45_16080 [Candidatus Aminicenantes bacterium]|nr:hypothetical protein [Candidatus Aminicenantes bacterium]NIM80297.1 hypothetical protein [Candidatus Aminicenantes bacterium]NIN19644.1 hypothetical protein [Candidatus Aminicenantes bacterium]NIN43526.1 hypothetical protein [Candidatus Aminicenantes bacterium]NIN86271.1 hypothetical protein [Candidatus Aminicenantes bacterium]
MKRFEIFSRSEKRLFFSITGLVGVFLGFIVYMLLDLEDEELLELQLEGEQFVLVIGIFLAVYAALVIILTGVKNKEILKKFALSIRPVPSKWREFIFR